MYGLAIRRRWWALGLTAATLAALSVGSDAEPADEPRGTSRAGIQILEGGEDKAELYEKEILDELGLAATQPHRKLDSLLAYCGYAGLTAADLAKLSPDVLMHDDRLAQSVSKPAEFRAWREVSPPAPGDILAVRFFAPKTTDVSGKQQPLVYSWRKVVRLRPRAGSSAASHGVTSLLALVNYGSHDLSRSPYDEDPKHIQIILARGKPEPGKMPLYWLVYGSPGDGAPLTWMAETSWDAIDPTRAKPDDPNTPYWAPHACMDCHTAREGDSGSGLLTMLDPDYWMDRTADDFPELAASQWSPLFDGGRDPSSAEYRRAWNVVRQLNGETLAQNESVAPAAFQTRSVQAWLAAHGDDDPQRLSVFQRAIPGPDGERWQADHEADAELLPLLSRYCYRCHGTHRYDVFDKAVVLSKLDELKYYVESGEMPRDRTLPDDVKARILKRLDDLAAPP